jgi:O-antigen/teichoic acid export membrane protein
LNKQKSSYHQILNATIIFGGVQFINIIISIIRSKFIAVLIGPIGIGISGMLTATISIISGLTSFGLGTSAIRDISKAHETGNSIRFAIITKVLKQLVWVTGLLGFLVALILSPTLSYMAFGNFDYTIAFVILSITLLINQLNVGQLAVLQGSRRLSHLAKANVIGSIIGLFTTLPLYYIWGLDGIVPALLFSSIVALFISAYYSNKVEIEKIRVSKIRSFSEGKLMLKMGFMISMSGFITLGFSYLVRLYITHVGGLSELGFYNAGFAIITTYVGLVFTAMGTDYYPRLAAVSDSIEKTNQTVNNQAEIALIILGPIILGFILFIKWIITVLYSHEFLNVSEMVIWAAVGMFFKAMSWSIGYLFLARSGSKLFFWNELITNIYLTLINILFYWIWGLTGLGISFAIIYCIHFLQVYFVAKVKYKYEVKPEVLFILTFQILFSVLGLFLYYNATGLMFFTSSIVLFIINVYYSFRILNTRIEIKTVLRNFTSKL